MIRLVIAEDQSILREALATLLSFEEDMKIVGKASDGVEALRIIETVQPDICLLDIEMPKMSGLDVAKSLKVQGTSCKVIILTTFARPGYFEQALAADVKGYIMKDTEINELTNTIRKVMVGKREYASELVMAKFANPNPLTERECDILQHAATGKTAKEIGVILHLSPGTVRNYLSDIQQKVDAKNTIEAIRICRNNGWLDE